MEKPEVIICNWTVSLYNDKKRKWMYGVLNLRADEVEFSPSDKKSSPNGSDVMIPLEDWIDIKKATTGMVFGAVYIVTKDNKKHWFSSLEDREGFYGTLNHFWKAQLFQKKDQTRSASGVGRKTKLGETLVGLVQDSQETLSGAAVQLHSQGRQIDSSLWTMSDLHNDLDVAERLVKDVESWVGRWRLPKQYNTVDPVVVNKCDIPEVFETEVVYSKLEVGKSNPRVVGLLRMCRDGVYILSQKQSLIHHFRWSDVSKIRVVTPYEMMIVQYCLGKADLVYCVVCANMMAILRLVEKCAKYKLEYDKPPDTVLCTSHQARQERNIGQGTEIEDENLFVRLPLNKSKFKVPTHQFDTAPQLQVTQEAQVISDQEVDEICRGLTSLKSLALSVQEEESVQNEKLDSLRTTVDRANERLTAVNKRVKRML